MPSYSNEDALHDDMLIELVIMSPSAIPAEPADSELVPLTVQSDAPLRLVRERRVSHMLFGYYYTLPPTLYPFHN